MEPEPAPTASSDVRINVMLAVLACALLQQSPIALLQGVRDRFQRLSSYSVDIEIKNETPYSEKLLWSKGGRFELRVTKRGQAKAPDIYCDGQQYFFKFPDGHTEIRLIPTQTNTPPTLKDPTPEDYEQQAGIALSWLLDTPYGKIFFNPPKSMTLDFDLGASVNWNDMAVRQVNLTMHEGKANQVTTFYISADGRGLAGTETKGTQIIYRNPRENPILLPSLGTYFGD